VFGFAYYPDLICTGQSGGYDKTLERLDERRAQSLQVEMNFCIYCNRAISGGEFLMGRIDGFAHSCIKVVMLSVLGSVRR